MERAALITAALIVAIMNISRTWVNNAILERMLVLYKGALQTVEKSPAIHALRRWISPPCVRQHVGMECKLVMKNAMTVTQTTMMGVQRTVDWNLDLTALHKMEG